MCYFYPLIIIYNRFKLFIVVYIGQSFLNNHYLLIWLNVISTIELFHWKQFVVSKFIFLSTRTFSSTYLRSSFTIATYLFAQPWNCFRGFGVGLDSYKSALCLRSRGKIKTLPACQVGRHAAYNVVHASNSAARSPLDFDDSAQDRLSEVRSFLASCLQLLTLNW